MRIVGEPKTLLRNSKQIPVQLVVPVFIMNHHDGVLARGHLKNLRRLTVSNRKPAMHDRQLRVLRPSLRRGVHCAPSLPLLVAESRHVNPERTQGLPRLRS